jgi:hypothetical protein
VTLGVLALLYVWRVNHEALAGRVNPHRGTRGRDKALLGLFFLTGLATVPVAAIGGGRSRRSTVPWWVCLVGYALPVGGVVLLTGAQAANKIRAACRSSLCWACG